jgi:hypothetical protein
MTKKSLLRRLLIPAYRTLITGFILALLVAVSVDAATVTVDSSADLPGGVLQRLGFPLFGEPVRPALRVQLSDRRPCPYRATPNQQFTRQPIRRPNEL